MGKLIFSLIFFVALVLSPISAFSQKVEPTSCGRTIVGGGQLDPSQVSLPKKGSTSDLCSDPEPPLDDYDAPAAAVFGGPGSTVVLHNGEKRLDRVDLHVPGRGHIGFVLYRRYRSQVEFNGPLGHNWDFNYNEALVVLDNGDVLRLNGMGRQDLWDKKGSRYISPVGYFSTLVQEPDGSFILRSPNGFKRFYTPGGRLDRYEDRFGNQMQFSYDGSGNLDVVTDPYGRVYDFIFEEIIDGPDRLIQVKDFFNRVVEYTYDADGDLVSVRSPTVTGTSTGNDFPDGRTEEYTYSSGLPDPRLNHNLLTATYPEEVAISGPPVMVCTYGVDPSDPFIFDRVLTDTFGGTNASGIAAGGTTTFAYEGIKGGKQPRVKILVTERNGNLMEYSTDNLSHLVQARRLTRGFRPGEPAFYESTNEYTKDGLVTSTVFPEGNSVEYSYDSRGPRMSQRNLLSIRRIADPARGGGEDLVTTFTYEPVYNQTASVTDPRGNATGFVPPIGTASAARYTSRYFYDYQEGGDPIPDVARFSIDISEAPRNLGDLNDDARTDQVAGNLVQIFSPNVELLPGSNEAARLGSPLQTIETQIQWNDQGQTVASIDPEGNVHTLDYFPENDPDGDGTPVPGQVSTVAAGYLLASTQDATTSPRRTSAETPVALRMEYTYDPVGNLIQTKNPRGIVTEFEVNQLNETVMVTRGADIADALANGQLLEEIIPTPLQYKTKLFYDHNGRVVGLDVENRDSTTAGVGDFVERTFIYDINSNLVESTVEVDAVKTLHTLYGYDPNDLPQQITQPEGNKARTEYDERNLVITQTLGFESAEASTIQVDYDKNANPVRLVDAEDTDGDGQREVTNYLYDGFDRLIGTMDPLMNESVMSYDVASNQVRIQVFGHPADQPLTPNVLLADVTQSHDELNRVFQGDQKLFLSDGFTPTRIVNLLDENSDGFVTTRQEYDALSRPTFSVEDDLETTKTTYDGASRPIEKEDAFGNIQTVVYDQNSNPVEMRSFEFSTDNQTSVEEFVVFYVWDQLDRVSRISRGLTTRFQYDSRDNLVGVSDPQGTEIPDPLEFFPGTTNTPGNTKTFNYDGRDLRIAVVADLREDGQGDSPLDLTNPFNTDGQITLGYAFDDNSRLSKIIDDQGNETQFMYDALNRPIEKKNADLTTYSYVYDRDHNVEQVIDPNGTTITNTYDALNRPIQKEILQATGIIGTELETYSYDGLSRPTTATDDNGSAPATHSVSWIYDSLSRVLEEHQDSEVCSSVWSGDSKKLSTTYPGGRQLDMGYDVVDRIESINESATPIASYKWIGPGYQRPISRTNGNGTVMSFLNDAGNQASGYDEFKRISNQRHSLADNAFINRNYEYNRASQRTSEERLDDESLTDLYTYDSAYRLVDTDYDEFGGAGALPRDLQDMSYLFDGVGNRREVSRTILGATGTEASSVNEVNEYTQIGADLRVHDDNGNLNDNAYLLYHFDYRDRLVQVNRKSDDVLVATYEYDSLNRRVKKTIFDLNDPGVILKETRYFYDDGFRVIEEQGGGNTETTYVYGIGIDEPVQMNHTTAAPSGTGTFYLHQNARGDVVGMTDPAGVVADTTRYEDFGAPDLESPFANPYHFQGRRFDPETGLYYFRNRYYDPKAGRFIQRDPVWDSGNVGNQYTFASNGPVSRSDPMGLQEEDSFMRTTDWMCSKADWVIDLAILDLKFLYTVGYVWNPIGWVNRLGADAATIIYTDKAEGWLNFDGKGARSPGFELPGQTFPEGQSQYASWLSRSIESNVQESMSTPGVSNFEAGAWAWGWAMGDVLIASNIWTGIPYMAWGISQGLRNGNPDQVINSMIGLILHLRGLKAHHGQTGSYNPFAEPLPPIAPNPNVKGVNNVQPTPKLFPPWWKPQPHKPNVKGVNPESGIILHWWVWGWYKVTGVPITLLQAGYLGPLGPQGDGNGIGQAAYYHSQDFTYRTVNFYGYDNEIKYEVECPKYVRVDGSIPFEANDDNFPMVPPGIVSNFFVTANDLNGGHPSPELTFQLVSPPDIHPDLFTWNGDGSFSITPTTFSGPFTFTYKIVAGLDESNVATVTINPDPTKLYDLPVFDDGGVASVKVPTLFIEGQNYPTYQFNLFDSPGDCGGPHWHWLGVDVFSLEFPTMGLEDPVVADPVGSACGFGLFTVVGQSEQIIPAADWQNFLTLHPPLI